MPDRLRLGPVAVAVLLLVPAVSGCQGAADSPSVRRSASATSSSAAPAPDGAALPASVADSLQAALRRALSYGAPGIEAAVVTDHGTWEGAAGADGLGAAVSPAALMAVGSVSKTFTAAEILHLAAEGTLDLDAPLSRWVHSPLVANGATVRQALGMLAGLKDGQYWGRLQEVSTRTPDARVTLDEAIATDVEKPGPPGQTQAYSNVSFLLLARVVEAVTHRSYAAAVHADLLEPTGLTRVAVQDSDKPAPPLAYPVDPYGHKPWTDGYLPDRYVASAAIGAGSIAATAHDEALWGYDLYLGRVLPPSLTAQMLKPQRAGSLSVGYPYGLGTVAFDANALGLDPGAVGHTGFVYRRNGVGKDGYQSILLVSPSKHVSVAVTIDSAAGYGPTATAVALLRSVASS